MQRFQTRSLQVFLRMQERWNKYKNHPLTWLGIFVLLAVIVGVFLVEPALATDAAPEPASKNVVKRIVGYFAGLIMEYFVPAVNTFFNLLISIVITIMQYNGFSTSSVVGVGWVIVRDIMNLFFVIVLIIIAMGTIFTGTATRFKWQQQVPRLMLFALLINFSRTICGIMIDFGQVIMLTFANALKEIAVGNFVQMFGITDFYSYAKGAGVNTGENWEFEYFVVAFMTACVMVAVTITMGIFVLILIYRIIVLWVLVVLSPLAFFLGGAKSLFGQEGYTKWWTQFKCAVIIGPVLAFFLWLTLSVAGAGSISLTEGFTSISTANDNPAGILSKIFQKDNFISLLIGLGMMYAGFDAASSVCGSDAVFSGLIGRAKGAVSTAAKWTAGGAAGLAIMGSREGAKATAKFGEGAGKAAAGVGGAVLTGATAGLVASDNKVLRGIGKAARVPTKQGRADIARGLAGGKNKTVARLAGGYADTLDKKVAGSYLEAGKGMEGASRQTKLDYLDSVARGGKPALPGEQKRAAMAFSQTMSDPKALEELEKKGQLKGLYSMFGADVENIAGADDKAADRLSVFKESRPDITGDIEKIDATNVGKLGAAAFAGAAVKSHLMKQPAPSGSKAKTLYDHVDQGYLGVAKQRALQEGVSGMYKNSSGAELAGYDPENLAEHITVNMIDKSPGMVAKVMNSTNPKVQQDVRGLKPEVYDRMMRAHAGITADGTVEDPAKFKTALSSNPVMVATFSPKMMSGGGSKAIAENFGTKEWQKASAQIQKNPDENAELRMNLAQASDEAAKSGVGESSVKGAAMFDRQMEAMDKRQESAEVKQELAGQKKAEASSTIVRTQASEQLKAMSGQLESMNTSMVEARDKMRIAQEKSQEAIAKNDYTRATKFDNIAKKYQLKSENLAGKIDGLNRKTQEINENVS